MQKSLIFILIVSIIFVSGCAIEADNPNDISNDDISIINFSNNQLSKDFLLNVGEFSETDDFLSNTQGVYLDWWWKYLEPEDDVYNWDYLEYTGTIDSNGELITDAKHVYVRLGVIATSAWIVGEGMDSFQETGYPEWINKSDLNNVEDKYLEFVDALINHLNFEPEFYMIEVEINVLGINAGLNNSEIVSWLDRLVNKIKSIDDDSLISIVVTSHDLSPFMSEGVIVNPALVKRDKYPLNVTDFLKSMNDIDYDIISVFIQPFGWMSKGDWHDAKYFVESLCNFNKSVYIASIGFLAKEPVVPEILNPNPNEINSPDSGFIYYPNNNTEEWQMNQTINFLNYSFYNPCIIGVHLDYIDYIEIGTGGKDVNVKLATGVTDGYRNIASNEIIFGNKRLVYEPLKELIFKYEND